MAEQYKVKLMSRALRDLDSIYKYIAETLLESNTALNLVIEVVFVSHGYPPTAT